MVRTTKRTSIVSDAAILAKMDECGGHISRTAKELRIRKSRVVAVNRAAGNPAKGKKERTAIEAAEDEVTRLCYVIQNLTLSDGKLASDLARMFGKATDRYMALVEKANAHRPSVPAVTLSDLLRIPRAELLELIRKHDERAGVMPPPEVGASTSPRESDPIPSTSTHVG